MVPWKASFLYHQKLIVYDLFFVMNPNNMYHKSYIGERFSSHNLYLCFAPSIFTAYRLPFGVSSEGFRARVMTEAPRPPAIGGIDWCVIGVMIHGRDARWQIGAAAAAAGRCGCPRRRPSERRADQTATICLYDAGIESDSRMIYVPSQG